MGATKQDIRIFTEEEIEIITSNYSTVIGRGSFGEVYKGILDGDNDWVAVKKYIQADLREEFMEEVSIHSQLNHKNVVRLIGYCLSGSTLLLVTEFVSRGNLDQLLHGSDSPIPLDIRLGIAIGCAEALSYMHSMHLSSDSLVYHGDIKPENILLDDNLTAKVSDFGLSRLLIGGITQFTSIVKGSLAYMDPLCLHEGCLTPRSDVYSFGVVLSELISRKRVKEGDASLIKKFSKSSVKGRDLRELVDAEIADDKNMEILKEMRNLASKCLTLTIHARPSINDVVKRLWILKKDLKSSSQSILAQHYVWRKQDKHGTSTSSFKRSFSFLMGNTSNSKIPLELGQNVRVFTIEEINEVTENYSCRLGRGTSGEVYRGKLEDNTQVVVRKFLSKDSKEAFINRGVMLSQIVHKNIIKLLGYCLEDEIPVFVYEYSANGSLSDILGSHQDFPLDLRMRIAIKIAEALEFLHSPTTGIIGHGHVTASNILLDDNFVPKLADFSVACKLIKASEITAGDNVIDASLLGKVLSDDPSRYESVLLNLESDVYKFGGVLLALISQEKDIDHNELIIKFTEAYEKDRSGKALFDKSITYDEDVDLLEDFGRLALKCTILNVDEMPKRPTMKEVAEHLRMVRRSWKERTTNEATQVIDPAPVVSGQPRLPNLMRHLYGYRRISIDDPVHV